MAAKKTPAKVRGVYEREPGSGIWWIRYEVEGMQRREKVGRVDESLQRLYMEFSKGQDRDGRAGNWRELQANLKGRSFFRPGPLMRALECEKPCVLLIDELDKVDEGFEALLLEILSARQLLIRNFQGSD